MNTKPWSLAILAMLLTAALFLLTACTKGPQLTEAGKKVELVENPEVMQDKLDDPEKCKLMAELRVQVKNPLVLGLKSRAASEAKDRLVRARNMAAENDANVLVPQGKVEDHEQDFKAYKCS